MSKECPFADVCATINNGSLKTMDDTQQLQFFDQLQALAINHQNEALRCYTSNRKCALRYDNWNKIYGDGFITYRLSRSCEPLGNL